LIVAADLALTEPAFTAVRLRCGNRSATYSDEAVLLQNA
jgi:hypothetical protein